MASGDRSTTGAAEREDRLPAWVRWGVPLLLFFAALLPFLPARSFGFVDYDDDRNFYPQYNPYFNAQTHSLSGPTLEWMLTASHFGHYQPLTWLSFGLDVALSGRFDPRDFHRTNLLLHALNAVLVYWLAGLLLRAVFRERVREVPLAIAAAATSLLYALHPMRVESVAWITERRDVLSGAFLLIAVAAYVRFATGRGRRVLWMSLSLATYAVSLLAKAWGITLPVVLLLIDLYPLRRRSGETPESWTRLLREKLLYAVPALLFAWLAKSAQAEIGASVSFEAHGVLQRIAQACYGLLFYPLKTLWPTGLSPLYLLEPVLDVSRPVYLVSMALVAAAVAALFAVRKRLPGLVAAFVAYAILVSPVLGFLQSGSQKVADRYTYLAILPLMLLVGWGVLRLAQAQAPRAPARRGAVLLGTVLLAAALGVAARRQTWFWKDSISVYQRVIDVEPDNYFGQHCLSVVLIQAGRLEEALLHAQAAVAAHGGLENIEGRRNLAFVLRRLGRKDESDQALLASLEVAPNWLPSLQDYVRYKLADGDPDAALAAVERSLARAPAFLDGYAQLARVQVTRGRRDLVVDAWRRALAVDPGWPLGNHGLGLAALEGGNPVEAEAYLVRALARGVQNVEALVDLGRAQQAQGKVQDAALRYRQALELAPGNTRARVLLGELTGQPAAPR